MDTIDKIMHLMFSQNVTAAKLNRDIGLSNSLITQWKQRKQNPSLDNLKKLAAYFGVSLSYFDDDNNSTIDRAASTNDIKFALFGTSDIDDEVLDEVKRYARFVKDRKNGDNKDL